MAIRKGLSFERLHEFRTKSITAFRGEDVNCQHGCHIAFLVEGTAWSDRRPLETTRFMSRHLLFETSFRDICEVSLSQSPSDRGRARHEARPRHRWIACVGATRDGRTSGIE